MTPANGGEMAKRTKPVWSTFTAQCIVLAYGVRFYRAGNDVIIKPPEGSYKAIEYFLGEELRCIANNMFNGNGWSKYYSLPKAWFQMSKRDWRTITIAPWAESHRQGMNKPIANAIVMQTPLSDPPHWYSGVLKLTN